jgi:hypothetical protein
MITPAFYNIGRPGVLSAISCPICSSFDHNNMKTIVKHIESEHAVSNVTWNSSPEPLKAPLAVQVELLSRSHLPSPLSAITAPTSSRSVENGNQNLGREAMVVVEGDAESDDDMWGSHENEDVGSHLDSPLTPSLLPSRVASFDSHRRLIMANKFLDEHVVFS